MTKKKSVDYKIYNQLVKTNKHNEACIDMLKKHIPFYKRWLWKLLDKRGYDYCFKINKVD